MPLLKALVGCAIVFFVVSAFRRTSDRSGPAEAGHHGCFLLYEIGVGEVRRNPSDTCATRVAPQSTFKVPHALAALDAGVVTDADTLIKYDGHAVDFPAWGRDHTLASAMRFSVVWYFQEIARRLGMERERAYLERFHYGNQDPSGGLTTFWLGQSLAISPEEQQRFLLDLYGDKLRASPAAVATVKRILVQPAGVIVNALGEHPFAAPWPRDAAVSAKTGSGTAGGGRAVRWLIGHVRRGPRAWIFVSNVVGDGDTPALAAVDQAERALQDAGVLR
jgi:beta-lactamase class D